MTIAFVILHYKTLEETRECLDSLLKLTQPESIRMQIIVVDNASNNGSLESLHQQYGTTSDVHFIALPENCGFARGNNAGYAYAKDTLQADFIILLNNDTEIRQPDFMPKLLLIYESTAFDVLGPDIYTLDQQHQNPKAKRGYSKAEVDAKIRQTRCNLWLIKTGLYELLITWNRIKRKRQPVKPVRNSEMKQLSINNTMSSCTVAAWFLHLTIFGGSMGFFRAPFYIVRKKSSGRLLNRKICGWSMIRVSRSCTKKTGPHNLCIKRIGKNVFLS